MGHGLTIKKRKTDESEDQATVVKEAGCSKEYHEKVGDGEDCGSEACPNHNHG